MSTPFIAIALILICWLPGAVRAEEIQPDRPETTDSARLVPRGTYQLETGITISRERRAGMTAEQTFGSEAVLRIGAAQNVELNLEGEPFALVLGPPDAFGPGDVTLGIRYRFVEGVEDDPWSPSFAVKPFVTLPVRGEPIGSGRVDFGLLLLGSVALPLDFELEANAGVAAIGQTGSSDFRPQGIVSASLSRDLAPFMFAFLEIAYTSRAQRDVREQLALNTGLVYRVTPTFTLDAAVQTSLYGQGPDYLIRTGLSVRFGP